VRRIVSETRLLAPGGEETGGVELAGEVELARADLVALGAVHARGHEFDVGDDVVQLGAAWPDDVTREQVAMELNTDFSTKGLSAQEITAVVQAWQNGALSRDSMLDIFRRGEVLPEGRTNEEETRLAKADPTTKHTNDTKGAAGDRVAGG
jgi:hypothetical protein